MKRARRIRISVSMSSEDLEAIDTAAQAAGEARSAYLASAALARVRGESERLTRDQRRRLSAALVLAIASI